MHIPVLQKEVIQYLDPKPNENFIDCTIGQAGHTLAILEKNAPEGKVLGIDKDCEIIRNTKSRIENTRHKDRIILVCDSFASLEKIAQVYNFKLVSGILFDLGMSSWHLEESGRGFSFQREEPLDMRYRVEDSKGVSAGIIVNTWPPQEIEKIIREYGEERFSRQITKKIVETRKIKLIKTTFDLVDVVKKAVPAWYQHQRIHFSTKTFQALRIAVNDELTDLEKALPQALRILENNGKLAVISFHSLEDRIVKNFFKNKAKENYLKILTKKPIQPDKEEISANPRSRSAKLRAAIKI